MTPRFRRRLLRHHIPIGFASALATAVVLVILRDAEQLAYRWSMATGYVGLVLLGATLLPGPLAALSGRRYPTSTDLRRDIGIWAGVLTLVHFVAGWNVHMKHRWEYFLRAREGGGVTVRLDLFGFANYIGLAAVLLVILLLVLSNDRSLRALGASRWKRLQQWNPPMFALVVVHTAAYQVIEKRTAIWVLFAALTTAAVAWARLRGRRARQALEAGRQKPHASRV